MKSEAEIRRALREWILKKSDKIEPDRLTDQTPIIEQRIITSLQVMDLILVIERLAGSPVDVKRLKKGVFRSIDVIIDNFFRGRTNEP